LSEREIELGGSRSEVVEREGRRVLLIRWNTGKTSAGKLFGRYGEGGKPDFFRLLLGAVAGSLREQLGSEGEEVFNRIRDSRRFRDSVTRIFEEMKDWFFREVVPRYGLEKGDIFMIVAPLELDLETGELTWIRDRTEFYYWVRSDRCVAQREAGEEVKLREEVERLREENERLRREVEELRAKLDSLRRLLGSE